MVVYLDWVSGAQYCIFQPAIIMILAHQKHFLDTSTGFVLLISCFKLSKPNKALVIG